MSPTTTNSDDARITTGILQLCFAMLLVPVLDVFAKLLGRTLDPVQVTFMRFVMQILLLTLLWSGAGFGPSQKAPSACNLPAVCY